MNAVRKEIMRGGGKEWLTMLGRGEITAGSGSGGDVPVFHSAVNEGPSHVVFG